jgi:signal transduction histidine kinase
MFGEVNEKQAEYLQDILSSGRHLLSLINDILDLSKVEAGRLELELGRFHLPTALDNALTLVRERATRHGITLTPTVDAEVGVTGSDDRGRTPTPVPPLPSSKGAKRRLDEVCNRDRARVWQQPAGATARALDNADTGHGGAGGGRGSGGAAGQGGGGK